MNSNSSRPHVVIVEQPASKTLRFRYSCEGRSAGSIPGVNSTNQLKTYPTIKVANYTGPVYIITSCVTSEKPYRPHPHNLVGKDGCKRGISTIDFDAAPDKEYCFQNLGIQCVKKSIVHESLKERQQINVDPFNTGFDHLERIKEIDLNSVRLCFQVFLKEAKLKPLRPVVSDAIFDKKANADLVIFRLSDTTSYPTGGKQIILLCEKVAKDDIKIRFYQMERDKVVWEDYGIFQPQDVHRQMAITFKTPKYHQSGISEPCDVFVTLQRRSDGVESKPIMFQYIPDCCSNNHSSKKRKIAANKDFYDYIQHRKQPIAVGTVKSEVHGPPEATVQSYAATGAIVPATQCPDASAQGAVGCSGTVYAGDIGPAIPTASMSNQYYEPAYYHGNQFVPPTALNQAPAIASSMSHWNISQTTQMFNDPSQMDNNNQQQQQQLLYQQQQQTYSTHYNILPHHQQQVQQQQVQQQHHHHHLHQQQPQVPPTNNYQHLQFPAMSKHEMVPQDTSTNLPYLELHSTDLQLLTQPAAFDATAQTAMVQPPPVAVVEEDVENMTDSFNSLSTFN